MPQGIILAAGTASRAHTNKLLLELKGRFLIQYALDSMRPYVSHIFVVTGHYQKDIEVALAKESDVTLIHNVDYEEGMFTSVLKGVAHINDDFFILPGDCPFVSEETYRLLLNGQGQIRVPTYQGRSGHPIYLSYELQKALLNEPRASNLKAFRNRYEYQRIPTNDQHILNDIDTIQDYEALMKEVGKD